VIASVAGGDRAGFPARRAPSRSAMGPLNVDSRRSFERLKCANTGHCPRARRVSQIDPLLPFKIGPVNGREAPESGLPLTASVAPRADAQGDLSDSGESARSAARRTTSLSELKMAHELARRLPPSERRRACRGGTRGLSPCDPDEQPFLAPPLGIRLTASTSARRRASATRASPCGP
jgi:hypothetical protein